ncbi:MAG: conjugal transfer protein [Solirubrobacteraceae bacterium]
MRALLRDRVVVRRVIVGASIALVAIAVAANTVFRPTNVVIERVPDARVNAPADAVAQSFTAAYLMVSDDEQARATALAPYGENSAWDVSSDQANPQRHVVATQVSGVSIRADDHDRIVTVEAQLSTGTTEYLAVRTRTRDGEVSIVGAPAVVGGPAIGRAVPERETDGDAAPADVVDVVTRAMRHLLAARAADLAPDLAPDASVSLPAQPLTLDDISSVVWVADPAPNAGTVQVRLTATDPDGVELTLDYELDLVRTDQGRWQLSVAHLPGAPK